jgi:hypothetical protein
MFSHRPKAMVMVIVVAGLSIKVHAELDAMRNGISSSKAPSPNRVICPQNACPVIQCRRIQNQDRETCTVLTLCIPPTRTASFPTHCSILDPSVHLISQHACFVTTTTTTTTTTSTTIYPKLPNAHTPQAFLPKLLNLSSMGANCFSPAGLSGCPKTN